MIINNPNPFTYHDQYVISKMKFIKILDIILKKILEKIVSGRYS